ncbi:MAG TPA: ribonuclease III [Polyangia bacterium]|nr:ribonuclease III [Polyangia bacterium]
MDDYTRLEQRLGYQFQQIELLKTALTHKSFVNENPTLAQEDNERLEFLGDAVLDLAVGHLLMERFPVRSEGELSKRRAAIVNEPGLWDVAETLGLGEWLFLGRGEEQTGGRRKASLLADACEAVLAAVYLDGGFPAAFRVIRRLFEERIVLTQRAGAEDYKTQLQEMVQARLRQVPRYIVVAEHGPDHEKTFEIAVQIGGREVARGSGKSKKEAEQRAAAGALAQLEVQPLE